MDEATVASEPHPLHLSNSSPSSYLPPPIRWSHEISSMNRKTIPKNSKRGRKSFFKASPLTILTAVDPYPLERQFRGAWRGSQGRRPWSKIENYDSLPFFREILPPFSRPFPFLFPAGLLIQLSRVPCRDQCATPLVCGVWTGGPFVL